MAPKPKPAKRGTHRIVQSKPAPKLPRVRASTAVVEMTKRDRPDQILEQWRAQGGRNTLTDLFPGAQWAQVRKDIIARGIAENPKSGAAILMQTKEIEGTDEHEVISIAAAVARDPGLTRDLITNIQDFLPTVELPNIVRTRQNWMIYRNENIINNAVNKYAALVSTGGRFKVKGAKQGKKQDAVERLQAILDEFYRNVNTAPIDGVVTAQRGLKLLQHSAVRQCLVEGDWIGRTVWSKHQVGTYGSFSMPMTIQSISLTYIEDVPALAGTGIEAFYWVPNTTLVQQVRSNTDPNVTKLLKKFFPSKILSDLQKSGKTFLDPALLCHVKFRQVYENSFGESFISSVQVAIAYKRAIEALDLVSMQSLINRLQIIMVGSSDPNSPYSKPEVAQQRAALLQNFFNDPGPYMTLVWQGNDIEVKDVSAHNAVLDLNGRHQIADSKIKMGLGMPDSLLTGTAQGSDGKAAGWAAAIGAAATADEIKAQFEQCWSTLGERIAIENNFDEYDIVYESDSSLALDKDAMFNQVRNDYLAGLTTIEDFLVSRGRNPEAAFQRMCTEKGLDPDSATWAQAFAPPQGLPGQGVSGVGGPARTVHDNPTIEVPKEQPDEEPGPDGHTEDTQGGPAAPAAPPPGTAPGKSPTKGRTPNQVQGKPPAPSKPRKGPKERK